MSPRKHTPADDSTTAVLDPPETREPSPGDTFRFTTHSGDYSPLAKHARANGGIVTRRDLAVAGFADAIDFMILKRQLTPINAPELGPPEPLDWYREQFTGLSGKEASLLALEIARDAVARRPFTESIRANQVFEALEPLLAPGDVVHFLRALPDIRSHEREARDLANLAIVRLTEQLGPEHKTTELCDRFRSLLKHSSGDADFKRAARALERMGDRSAPTVRACLLAAIETTSPAIREEAASLAASLITTAREG